MCVTKYFCFLIFLSNFFLNISSKKYLSLTGSTGVLGQSLLFNSCSRGFQEVYAGYRNYHKMETLLIERLALYKELIRPFQFEVRKGIISTFPVIKKDCNHFIHINNAGICHRGLSRSIFAQSIEVNSLAPIRLAQHIILNNSIQTSCNISIINISSGDGEIVYLNSYLQRRLMDINSIEVRAIMIIYRFDGFLVMCLF